MAVTENVSSCSLSAMWDWSHWSPSGTPPAVSLLDAAADLLVLERNFSGALELCERGLQILTVEPKDKYEQLKAHLCVVGIQALAEMERWREVLPWLVQYYRTPQEMPHNIMEMCLLLYSKVKQPHVMLELSSSWLNERANHHLSGYRRVAELHLLRVLLPLGLFSEAECLAKDSKMLTQQQQLIVLKTISEQKRQWEEKNDPAKSETNQCDQTVSQAKRDKGNSRVGILNMARILYGSLSLVATQICKVPFRRTVLALLLLYVILVRLDPAFPVSQGPMRRLLLLLRACISNIFQRAH
ncbi:peroxisome assembly 26 isoform X5 [Pelobates cultripes]|uniref:Peroxisome assembly 26 isoform X5 n=1 Tax=Pelobates cultripes TaxID=61616 RepID=A0AAD1W3I3_PELCU|nr:peroxisome assembly 26 isoform X5 [Pelobates cultripes]